MLKRLFKALQHSVTAVIHSSPGETGPHPGPAAAVPPIEDDIAGMTEWGPVEKGGYNFSTHDLISVNPSRYEIRLSTGGKLFHLLFLFIGSGILIALVMAYMFLDSTVLGGYILIPLAIGLVFTWAGGHGLYTEMPAIVFDKSKNLFWKGRKEPERIYATSLAKGLVRLDDIYALQLVSEWVATRKSSFYSHELNLVLKDGKRINVADHGDSLKLRNDAETLSVFLGIPVWDALTEQEDNAR